MSHSSILSLVFLFCQASVSWASGIIETIDPDDLAKLDAAQVVLLGERHDNPDHHKVQAQMVERLKPSAIVFEMLTESQVDAITYENRGSEAALEDALNWAESGWPDFAMYYPVFAAAPEARIYGAQLDREIARDAIRDGVETVFGTDAELYGLTEPLDENEQSSREELQAVAHCNKLPEDMLPAMVDVQRMRDAVLARTTLAALNETGGPVVVITGNGHARKDWGVPVFLRAIEPDLALVSLGQGEDDSPPVGKFDVILSSPAPEREDPCEVFN